MDHAADKKFAQEDVNALISRTETTQARPPRLRGRGAPMSEELREFVRQFGERVERFRILGGWTRDDVAQRAAINPFYLREVELGRRDVSMSTAHRLAIALGTPLRELLGAPPVALSGMGKMWAQEVTNASPALGDLMVRLLQMGHANQAASARSAEQKASARTPRRKIKAGT